MWSFWGWNFHFLDRHVASFLPLKTLYQTYIMNLTFLGCLGAFQSAQSYEAFALLPYSPPSALASFLRCRLTCSPQSAPHRSLLSSSGRAMPRPQAAISPAEYLPAQSSLTACSSLASCWPPEKGRKIQRFCHQDLLGV